MKHFLIVTDIIKKGYYDIIHNHMLENYSDEIKITQLELHQPFHNEIQAIDDMDLIVYWLQDPLINRRKDFTAAINTMFPHMPMINAPTFLSNTEKHKVTICCSKAGFRTPWMKLFAKGTMPPELPFPFFVRENAEHGKKMYLVKSPEDLKDVTIQYGITHNIANPVAIEYIDTSTPEPIKRFWKYRCFVTGDVCTPLHLQSSTNWITRGNARIQDELEYKMEHRYLQYNLNDTVISKKFVQAAKLLGFDTCAFDYAVDPKTLDIIPWECNVFPYLHYIENPRTEHHHMRNAQTKKVIDEIVKCYLRKAR